MLKRMTDEALQAELDRRKAKRDEKAKPQPVANPDWSRMREMAVNHVEDVLRRKGKDRDDEHYIYEQVLATVCGTDSWDTLNPFWR